MVGDLENMVFFWVQMVLDFFGKGVKKGAIFGANVDYPQILSEFIAPGFFSFWQLFVNILIEKYFFSHWL